MYKTIKYLIESYELKERRRNSCSLLNKKETYFKLTAKSRGK
jgi:hypothetical protein